MNILFHILHFRNLKKKQKNYRIKGKKGIDENVKHLNDPYLAEYSIDDFPRLKEFLNIHFTKKPEVCPERPQILTEWFRENGWEKDRNGNPWLQGFKGDSLLLQVPHLNIFTKNSIALFLL